MQPAQRLLKTLNPSLIQRLETQLRTQVRAISKISNRLLVLLRPSRANDWLLGKGPGLFKHPHLRNCNASEHLQSHRPVRGSRRSLDNIAIGYQASDAFRDHKEIQSAFAASRT